MKKNSGKGFTLIELMIALSVGAILVTMAGPSFQGVVNRNRVATLTNGLVGGLNIARSEAIKRGVTVTVCRSSDQSTCSGTWSNGWIIFSDNDKDRVVDAGDEVLRVFSEIGQGRSLKYAGFPSSNYIQFLNTGFTDNQNGTFTVCDSTNNVNNARGIVISKTGRGRLSIDSDADGIHEDGSGNALTCP